MIRLADIAAAYHAFRQRSNRFDSPDDFYGPRVSMRLEMNWERVLQGVFR